MTQPEKPRRPRAFIEKAGLIVITGGLSGILIPVIDGEISAGRLKDQIEFQAELQRQSDIVDAQIQLLRRLSELYWEFQLMNINVSFYKLYGNDAGFRSAVIKYQDSAGDLLGRIRTEMSASRRLVSPDVYEQLSTLYYDILLPIDSNLENLINQGDQASDENWQEQHNASFGIAQEKIDNTLKDLAFAMDLAAATAR